MQIVIFDMDGTLIDSGSDITVSVNHVRNIVYHLPPLSRDFVVEAINRETRNLALLFYGVPVYESRAQQVFEHHYRDQCIRSPRLYEGINELLEALAERGAQLNVATNAPAQFARRMLTHLGVVDSFARIVGSEDVKKPKPHPDMLEAILNHHGYHPDSDIALMVGDNSKDMESARRAGILSVFATWGFSPAGIGDGVCSHPTELLTLLEEWTDYFYTKSSG